MIGGVFRKITIDGNGEQVVVAFDFGAGEDAREEGFDLGRVFAF